MFADIYFYDLKVVANIAKKALANINEFSVPFKSILRQGLHVPIAYGSMNKENWCKEAERLVVQRSHNINLATSYQSCHAMPWQKTHSLPGREEKSNIGPL